MEMLKAKAKAQNIIDQFGAGIRPIQVQFKMYNGHSFHDRYPMKRSQRSYGNTKIAVPKGIDRIGGYRNCADEILQYAQKRR